MIAPLPVAARPDRPAGGRTPMPLLPPAELARLAEAVAGVLEPATLDLEPRLAGAVSQTLAAPGSLWRAQLAWSVGRAAGLADEPALALACGVESFHTASLLFDDLPAMDDGELRRGIPCAHRVHGEAAATLAALAFVHRGYALIWRALDAAAPEARRRASELVEACLGLGGILDGQARDVRFAAAARRGEEEVVRIARGKTVTLLRLAIVLPAVTAGRPPRELAALEELADAWGLAYQILDDLGEDGAGPASSDARRGRPNLALVAGRAAAERRLALELARSRAALETLEGAGWAEVGVGVLRRLQDRLSPRRPFAVGR